MSGFWDGCLAFFEKELPSQQYNTWIKPLKPILDSDRLTLIVPNRFVLQWIKDKFLPAIQKMAAEYPGGPINILLSVADKPVAVPASNPATLESPSKQIAKRDHTRLNPSFTFDGFVTGKANQLARAAAVQVAERPGTAYNPLFIYGGVGLGKTHLIQAIGNSVRQRDEEARVRYIHAEHYVSAVIRAYEHKAFDEFKRYYHSLDLLLIDDIQFFGIGNKTRTQEEFFYAFNALIEARKQVVITCDSFPKDLAGIEKRLVSRFAWGLTVQVEPPEPEMRVAILLKKASAEGIALGEDIAFFIAQHIHSNVRELEGALKRVIAFSQFNKLPISLDCTREALKDLLAAQIRAISIDNIQRVVAEYYKLKVTDMHSKRRSRAVARPRQIAMALAKELTTLSLPDIGEAFGGRDHTTVLHACRKVAQLRSDDHDVARDFGALLQMLRS
ncbi:MAG TPA: chromosomal replication initiator protein DnaA [Burkholderiales bacterium]|nr:chromosomal replication initiator protein DnaA [Burkholderiales bacterium]